MNHEKNLIGIFIKANNEERYISNSISALIKFCESLKRIKLNCIPILVDDGSKDKTLYISKNFPINIIHIEKKIGPAGASYIGMKYLLEKNCDYIISLDGDMIIKERPLIEIIQYMMENPNVGAIGGIIRSYTKNGKVLYNPFTPHLFQDKFIKVENFAGPAIYNSKIIKNVGLFNPYIKVAEEGELCYRIICAGYKILILNDILADHYGYIEESSIYRFIIKKIRRSFLYSFRLSASKLNKCTFKKTIYLVKYNFITAFYDFLVLTLYLLKISFYILLTSILILSLIYMIIIYKGVNNKKLLVRRILGLHITYFAIIIATIIGIILKIPPIDKFKPKMKIIKEGYSY